MIKEEAIDKLLAAQKEVVVSLQEAHDRLIDLEENEAWRAVLRYDFTEWEERRFKLAHGAVLIALSEVDDLRIGLEQLARSDYTLEGQEVEQDD